MNAYVTNTPAGFECKWTVSSVAEAKAWAKSFGYRYIWVDARDESGDLIEPQPAWVRMSAYE